MLPDRSAIDLRNQLTPSPTSDVIASSIRRCLLIENERPNVDHMAIDELLADYSLLVDDMKGLNNYAGVALQMAAGCKNDSARWRSSFQTDDLLKILTSDLENCDDQGDCSLAEVEARIGKHQASSLTDLLKRVLLAQSVDNPVPSTSQNQSCNPPVPEIKSVKETSSTGELPRLVGLKRTLHQSPDPPTPLDSNLNQTKRVHSEPSTEPRNASPFRTAGNLLQQNLQSKQSAGHGTLKRTLGGRRGTNSPFVLPIPSNDRDNSPNTLASATPNTLGNDTVQDERLKQFDQKIIELIMSEIMDSKTSVGWHDIAGLELQKKALQEVVILPMLRPDLFTGLRGPPKGLLLFGPPGTGKTLIGKCIASQSKSTFFCISASSLTSKWVGEGEKMVRALFAIARTQQPAVIFIDEVDSLLTQRSETEHESSRRIKTEFLVQLDGVSTADEEKLLFVGATNRPQELDEAARRRFVKRLYIPLPDRSAREHIVRHLLHEQRHSLTATDFSTIADRSEGYSGADMANLCREAAMGPIRSLSLEALQSIQPDQVRPVEMADFEAALKQVRATVSPNDLEQYRKWNKQYGGFDV